MKETKKAQNDQRIATNNIDKAMLKLSDLRRTEPLPRDSRIYPGNYSAVMVSEGGVRVLYPMRYKCLPPGKPFFLDAKLTDTYKARRDSLEGYWKGLFGRSHAIMTVDTFYENVPGPDGKNQVLQFTPRDGGPMYVACLWSRSAGPTPKASSPSCFRLLPSRTSQSQK